MSNLIWKLLDESKFRDYIPIYNKLCENILAAGYICKDRKYHIMNETLSSQILSSKTAEYERNGDNSSTIVCFVDSNHCKQELIDKDGKSSDKEIYRRQQNGIVSIEHYDKNDNLQYISYSSINDIGSNGIFQ